MLLILSLCRTVWSAVADFTRSEQTNCISTSSGIDSVCQFLLDRLVAPHPRAIFCSDMRLMLFVLFVLCLIKLLTCGVIRSYNVWWNYGTTFQKKTQFFLGTPLPDFSEKPTRLDVSEPGTPKSLGSEAALRKFDHEQNQGAKWTFFSPWVQLVHPFLGRGIEQFDQGLLGEKKRKCTVCTWISGISRICCDNHSHLWAIWLWAEGCHLIRTQWAMVYCRIPSFTSEHILFAHLNSSTRPSVCCFGDPPLTPGASCSAGRFWSRQAKEDRSETLPCSQLEGWPPFIETKLLRWQTAQDCPGAFGDYCCESLYLKCWLSRSSERVKRVSPEISIKRAIKWVWVRWFWVRQNSGVYLPHSHAPFSVNSRSLLLDSTFFLGKLPSDLPQDCGIIPRNTWRVFRSAEGSTILVFLPGIAEISSLWQAGWDSCWWFSCYSLGLYHVFLFFEWFCW